MIHPVRYFDGIYVFLNIPRFLKRATLRSAGPQNSGPYTVRRLDLGNWELQKGPENIGKNSRARVVWTLNLGNLGPENIGKNSGLLLKFLLGPENSGRT